VDSRINAQSTICATMLKRAFFEGEARQFGKNCLSSVPSSGNPFPVTLIAELTEQTGKFCRFAPKNGQDLPATAWKPVLHYAVIILRTRISTCREKHPWDHWKSDE
jgi:hypothetical protein